MLAHTFFFSFSFSFLFYFFFFSFQQLPGYPLCESLCGVWCFFRSGEITEQQTGSWKLSFVELSSEALVVSDHRLVETRPFFHSLSLTFKLKPSPLYRCVTSYLSKKESARTWRLDIGLGGGVKVEQLEHPERPFTVQLTLAVPREIKHLVAFSGRAIMFQWVRALAPFFHPSPACSDCNHL